MTKIPHHLNSNGNGQWPLDPQGLKEFGVAFSACAADWRSTHPFTRFTTQTGLGYKAYVQYLKGEEVPSLPVLRRIVAGVKRTFPEHAQHMVDAVFKAHRWEPYQPAEEIIRDLRFMKDRGQLLVKFRLAQLMELSEIKDATDIPLRTLRKYESGKRNYFNDRHKLADALIQGIEQKDARDLFIYTAEQLNPIPLPNPPRLPEPRPKPVRNPRVHIPKRDEEAIEHIFATPDKNFTSFGELAKATRGACDLSESQLAPRYGATKQAVSNIERDIHVPTEPTIRKWGKALELKKPYIKRAVDFVENCQTPNGHHRTNRFSHALHDYLQAHSDRRKKDHIDLHKIADHAEVPILTLTRIIDSKINAAPGTQHRIIRALGFESAEDFYKTAHPLQDSQSPPSHHR